MFDANMSHLSKGRKFFAEVYNVKKGTDLHEAVKESGKVLYCTMMEDTADNPAITIHLVDRDITMRGDDDFYGSWLVYAGCVDKEGKLHDFIDKSVEKKAGKVLNKLKRRE